jgi:hypothetical protein
MFKSLWQSIIIVTMLVSPLLGSELTSYRWKNRLLLIFSPNPSDIRYVGFHRDITREVAELEDRDLVVFRVFENGASFSADQPLTVEGAEMLRSRFEIEKGGLVVILIGKDGGVKMMRKDAPELQDIFERIDRMPMRRQEMMERK